MNNIVVFTLKGCGHCVELKKELILLEKPPLLNTPNNSFFFV